MPRKTLVQCPVVSGYVTARLQAQDWFQPAISGMPTTMLVTFENVGNTNFSVVLNETSDRSISGARTRLVGFSGTAAYLVPGGQQTLSLNGYLPILEVSCTGTTTGNLRMQIDSQRKWTEMGFDRSDPFYPPTLYEAAEIPGALIVSTPATALLADGLPGTTNSILLGDGIPGMRNPVIMFDP